MEESAGITVFGLHLLTGEGVDSGAPAFFGAGTVDQLIETGSWRRGALHGLKVSPPPELWPPRWRILAEPPGTAAN